jgi:hypothetical protein
VLPVHAGEADTVHSEDKSSIKNVLTNSEAEAANLDGAIALKVAHAYFEGSCKVESFKETKMPCQIFILDFVLRDVLDSFPMNLFFQ